MPLSLTLVVKSDYDGLEFAPVLGEKSRHWVAAGLV